MNIFLAGDSTVQQYDADITPQSGWGQFAADYFTDEVTFINHAIGGRSSKSFVVEGRLDAIFKEIGEGDYLFIQMGHNDAAIAKPERYTDPLTDYQSYLRMYIDGARDRRAIPILITPVGTLHYEAGKFINDFPDYCNAMKQLASEERVQLIDLMQMSLDAYTSAGYDEAFTYFMASVKGTDFVHFTEKGARRIAQLVARGVKESQLGLSIYVRSHAL